MRHFSHRLIFRHPAWNPSAPRDTNQDSMQ